ncbi:MAG: PEGA domain-containing protein [Thermoplasmataceae archaeon]
MNIKLTVSLLIVFSMATASFVGFGTSEFTGSHSSKVVAVLGSQGVFSEGLAGSHSSNDLPSTGGSFSGNVTIYSNGSLSTSSAPISVSGHVYTLTSSFVGSLNVEANNSILNGNNYTITGLSGILPVLTVSNASGVKVNDLSVSSSNNTSMGVLMFNTSMDQFTDVNVSVPYLGIEVSNFTSSINISHSRIAVGKGSLIDMGDILTGSYIGVDHTLEFAKDSKNISFYGDVIVNNGGLYGVLFNSPNSSLMNSSITMKGRNYRGTQGPDVFISDQNYTTVSNNSIYGINVSLGAGFVNFGFPFIPFKGDQFNGNNMKIVSPFYGGIGNSLALTAIFTNLSMKDNTIYGQNLQSGYALLSLIYGNFNVTGNSIKIVNSSNNPAIAECNVNTTTDSNSIVYSANSSLPSNCAVFIDSHNLNVDHNSITVNNISSSSDIMKVFGVGSSKIDSVSNNTIVGRNGSAVGIYFGGVNTTISRNSIYLNGSKPNGIVLSGSGLVVSDNTVYINSASTSTGIGDFLSSAGIYNSTISGNTVNITGNQSGSIFGMYFENPLNNLTLSNNYLTSDGKGFNGIEIESNSNSNLSISGNTIIDDYNSTGTFNGLTIVSVNSAVINGNVILGKGNAGSGGSSIAMSLRCLYNLVAANNTLEGVNTSLSMGIAVNVTFYGNYFQNQYIALNLVNLYNVTFYHNDFENFTVAAQVSSLAKASFNASYPVGGNYWANYTGVDQNHGPNQSIPGSDGIGDTPYSINATLKDNYPLMKPWTRPEAVFRSNGLFPGQAWSVTFNGKTITSKQKTISFAILNGTYQNYSYKIGTVAGYRGGGQSGELDYVGSGFTENVTYAHRFNVTFTEKGLPAGTSWSFELNGTVINVTTASYNLSAYNGTLFNYSIENSVLYYSNISSGSFTLSGYNVTIFIEYLHFAYIHGTVSPSQTSVIINGVNYGKYNGSYNISLKAGTYVVEFQHSGYTNRYVNVTLSAGQSFAANVSLVSTGGSLNSTIIIGAAAGAVVVAVALGSYFVLRRRHN